jgi:sulfatase maturation enzyme AslB (radical SAM superfamily)
MLTIPAAKQDTKRSTEEWKGRKRWNPFNSYKLLVHVERWRQIRRGRPVPPPVLITVDPTNVCNFNCAWCNAQYIREHRNFKLSEATLAALADYLPLWGRASGVSDPGVKAICIAGGGEPLLNRATPSFIDRVVAGGVDVGMVTNGSYIHECIDALSQATWVGVSVDAGNAATFNALKGLPANSEIFPRVIENIALLVDYSRRHYTRLGKQHPSYGVSYKYLLYKENIGEVFEAAKLAKKIGCKSIHFRPAGTTWDKIGTDQEICFTAADIALFEEEIARAMALDDETFSVYGVTHKFNSQFGISNCFAKCYSVFMTAVVSPPTSKTAPKDSYTLSLCCDRRGDAKLELLRDTPDVAAIEAAWGSREHWQIHDRINVEKECPRCTYQPHNQIYQEVILNDSMTYKFI